MIHHTASRTLIFIVMDGAAALPRGALNYSMTRTSCCLEARSLCTYELGTWPMIFWCPRVLAALGLLKRGSVECGTVLALGDSASLCASCLYITRGNSARALG